MWREQHGLTLANLLKASAPIAIASFFGLLYSTLESEKLWQIVASSTLLGVSGFTLLFTLCFVFPYKKWKWDTRMLQERVDDLGPLKVHRDSQCGHEEQWLHPVIEWIDLTRPSLRENEMKICYRIDSGLVFNFAPYRMWIKPIIGGYEPRKGTEIEQVPNLLAGRRSSSDSVTLTIDEKGLLDKIEACKQGTEMKRSLKIIMQLREAEELRSLESYDIDP